MKNFRKLEIWRRGIEIVKDSYEITKVLPPIERYALASQINRSSVSIPSNIAEGSSRKSEKDYQRFLEFALGSAFELETQLIILNELNLNEADKINNLIEKINIEQKMINKFIITLSQSIKKANS